MLLVVGVAVAYGLRQPDNTEPTGGLAVHVLDDGARVRIAVTHCPTFDLRQVRIVAVDEQNAGVQSHEVEMWHARPSSGQWLFDTKAAQSSFASLPSMQGHAAYEAIVDFDPTTAPGRWNGYSSMSVTFTAQESKGQQADFARISAQRC